MIGKIMTAFAGRSLARTLGGASAGPGGALIGAAVPVVFPRVARKLGPLGLIAAAVGGVAATRYATKRAKRKEEQQTAHALVPAPYGLDSTNPDGMAADRTTGPNNASSLTNSSSVNNDNSTPVGTMGDAGSTLSQTSQPTPPDVAPPVEAEPRTLNGDAIRH